MGVGTEVDYLFALGALLIYLFTLFTSTPCFLHRGMLSYRRGCQGRFSLGVILHAISIAARGDGR